MLRSAARGAFPGQQARWPPILGDVISDLAGRRAIAPLQPLPAGLLLFRWAFAVAALFHLAGNPALNFGDRSLLLIPVQLVVGSAALAVTVAPHRHTPMIVLCAAVPVSAWLEAPMVGNHWVLAAALAVAYLVSAGLGRLRDLDPMSSPWSMFAPAGRLVLLGAYGFAAFAKLNDGFMDPATSCAVFYQDQLVRSWGLPVLSVSGDPLLGQAVAVGAAVVELSIPVLLIWGVTRRWGVLLGMSFHGLLALDLAQHFWDFSAVLYACFLLFLSPSQQQHVVDDVTGVLRQVRPSVRLATAALPLLLGVTAVAAGTLGGPPALRVLAVFAGHAAWWVLGAMAIVLVARAVLTDGSREPGLLRVSSPALLVVPLLVALNGLTPYLELKTGFGWNMYSNLRTVAGETNHMLVPATLDLTGAQVDRVRVLESTDARLTTRPDVELVWSEFREYAHSNPDETVVYERGGEVFSAPTLGEDPAGRGGISVLGLRLGSFRAVDVSGKERCLDVFGPAR